MLNSLLLLTSLIWTALTLTANYFFVLYCSFLLPPSLPPSIHFVLSPLYSFLSILLLSLFPPSSILIFILFYFVSFLPSFFLQSFFIALLHSFIHSFIYLFVPSFIHSFIYSSIHSFLSSFLYSSISLFIYFCLWSSYHQMGTAIDGIAVTATNYGESQATDLEVSEGVCVCMCVCVWSGSRRLRGIRGIPLMWVYRPLNTSRRTSRSWCHYNSSDSSAKCKTGIQLVD